MPNERNRTQGHHAHHLPHPHRREDPRAEQADLRGGPGGQRSAGRANFGRKRSHPVARASRLCGIQGCSKVIPSWVQKRHWARLFFNYFFRGHFVYPCRVFGACLENERLNLASQCFSGLLRIHAHHVEQHIYQLTWRIALNIR